MKFLVKEWMIRSIILYDTFWQVLEVNGIDNSFEFYMLVNSMRKFPNFPLSFQISDSSKNNINNKTNLKIKQ